jgi:aryl-alcohol dehydrogenase
MNITAAVTPETGAPFALQEVELEEPRTDEVRVRIVATGVCHTDMVVRDQELPTPLPAVLGHEGAGVVDAVGESVTKVAPGDHVVLTYAYCGECPNCASGRPTYCLNFLAANFSGARLDGSTPIGGGVNGGFFGQSSFASHALVNERNVVKVPADAPLELLGPLGCGIQTGAGAVLNTLNVEAGSSLVVFGVGSVGLAAVMAGRVAGCTAIIAVDLNADRLALATELGATHALNPEDGDLVERIQELTGGIGADYSLDATANPEVLRQAVECLTVTGTCGLIGAAPLGTEVTLDMASILFGRTLRGVIEGDSVPDVFIPRLVELHRQGRFPVDRLVEFYDFAEINKAVEASEQGQVVKAILRMPV